jgi:hypothetical protein
MYLELREVGRWWAEVYRDWWCEWHLYVLLLAAFWWDSASVWWLKEVLNGAAKSERDFALKGLWCSLRGSRCSGLLWRVERSSQGGFLW